MPADQFQNGDDPSRPPDPPRPKESTPEKPTHESPETTEPETQPAEPRTRQEYADHVRPQDKDSPSDPLPDPVAPESHDSKDKHPEGASLEEEQSGGSSTDGQQTQDEPRVSNHSEGSDEQQPSLDDSLAEPANPLDVHNGKSDAERLDASKEDEGLGDALHHEDTVRGDDDNPEPLEGTASENKTSRSAEDDDVGSNKNAQHVEDQPRPLTNQEWAEHLDEVRGGLEKAREGGLRTNHLHTIDGKGQIWSAERELLHDAILEECYAKAADVPCDSKAIIAGGLGGAGKTTVLTEHAGIDLTQYLMINPDSFKEEMSRRGMLPEIDGLSPMEASDLAHEESSYLAKRLARRAEAEGKNLIWDITMSSQDSTVDRIRSLREAGYAHLDGIFVDIPIEISVKRTDSRHREGHENYRSGVGLGGRFVPPEVIRGQADSEWSSQNRKTYEAVKDSFSTWAIYDNSVNDRPATLIDSRTRRPE